MDLINFFDGWMTTLPPSITNNWGEMDLTTSWSDMMPEVNKSRIFFVVGIACSVIGCIFHCINDCADSRVKRFTLPIGLFITVIGSICEFIN